MGRGAAAIPTLMADLATWLDIDTLAWGQRYAVVTASAGSSTRSRPPRSPASPARWSGRQRTLDPRWRPLLAQVRDERASGWVPEQPPRPGEADAARAFAEYAVELGGGRTTSLRG